MASPAKPRSHARCRPQLREKFFSSRLSTSRCVSVCMYTVLLVRTHVARAIDTARKSRNTHTARFVRAAGRVRDDERDRALMLL